ncbi:MAG: ABC transporter substrate-binding protein [Halanaeroarchaeum sp.]
MPIRDIDRRRFLKLASAAGIASTAGCIGGGGDGGGGNFAEAAAKLNLDQSWQQRRFERARNDWPMEARKQTPPRDAETWTNSQAFKSAVENDVWKPPEGWQDTAAGDVDSIQIINHGAVNMTYDPATLAAHELFEEQTGITVNPIEIGVSQANQREQQVLSSQKSSPHLMNVTGALLPSFIQQGWIEQTDALYPEGVWEPYIPALQSLVRWSLGPGEGTHTYGSVNIAEGMVGHLRPDLMEEQGLDPARFQGEWSWDLLEEAMKAFEDTGTYAFAYYAGTATYLSYSYRQMLYQQGGRMVQEDGTVKVDTPESIRVVQKMKEWRDKGWVPGDVISYGEGDIVDLYLAGDLAYTHGFTDMVARAVETYEPNTEYKPIVPPAANAGGSSTQATLIDPNSTSINPYADEGHKLAAMLYGDLKLSYPTQWWELTYEGNLSYIDSVYDDAAQGGALRWGDIFGTAVSNGVVELFPQMSSVFQRMSNPIQSAIQGEITPADAMGQVQTYIDNNINTS